MLACLIECKANVNVESRWDLYLDPLFHLRGCTPLQVAINSGARNCAELLLEHGATEAEYKVRTCGNEREGAGGGSATLGCPRLSRDRAAAVRIRTPPSPYST